MVSASLYLLMLLKVRLYTLPLNYNFWQNLNLFRHGLADKVDYVYQLCSEYYNFYDRSHKRDKRCEKNVLEIGCGDLINTGLYFTTLGFSRAVLVDKADFAVTLIDGYRDFARNNGFLVKSNSFSVLLREFNVVYRTNGIDSLKTCCDSSIDPCFSNSVLQHFTFEEFVEFSNQLERILKSGAVSKHRIDLRNMYDQTMDHHLINKCIWECVYLRSMPFYTNRMMTENYIEIFERCGLKVLNCEKFFQSNYSQRNKGVKQSDINNADIIALDIELVKT